MLLQFFDLVNRQRASIHGQRASHSQRKAIAADATRGMLCITQNAGGLAKLLQPVPYIQGNIRKSLWTMFDLDPQIHDFFSKNIVGWRPGGGN